MAHVHGYEYEGCFIWNRVKADGNEKRRQFDAIIEEENLKRDKAVDFIENAYERGYVPEGGMELDGIMPPINPFDPTADRQGKIQKVVERLKEFFRRFASISNGDFGGM